MGELGVLFNPGMRHEREEKLAKQMLREDEGTGRKGRLGIDLESGVVVINSGTARPADDSAKSTDAHPVGDDDAKADRRSAATPGDGRASSGDRPAASGDRPAAAQDGGSRAARHTSAAPAGKAQRGATAAERAKPTGKSRRRSR